MSSNIFRRCLIPGCNGPSCLAGNPHYCRNCNTIGVNHRSKDCPILSNTMLSNISKFNNNVINNTIKPEYVSVVVICKKIFESAELLVCRRGVNDYNYGKMYTQGGHIDSGETPKQAAIRECMEESGIRINESQLIPIIVPDITNKMIVFVVVLNDKPVIYGPLHQHAWEILHTDDLSKDFNVEMIKSSNGSESNSGWAWIKSDIIMNVNTSNQLYEKYFVSRGRETMVYKIFKQLEKDKLI